MEKLGADLFSQFEDCEISDLNGIKGGHEPLTGEGIIVRSDGKYMNCTDGIVDGNVKYFCDEP